MVVLVIGVVMVAGLVAWALTRTVETTKPAPETTVAETAAPPTDTTTFGSISAPAAETAHPAPHIEGDRASVKRIAVEDLRAKVNRGDVTVIDVRDANAYSAAHIPGALNIPLASIEAQFDTIPKNKAIVTYCT